MQGKRGKNLPGHSSYARCHLWLYHLSSPQNYEVHISRKHLRLDKWRRSTVDSTTWQSICLHSLCLFQCTRKEYPETEPTSSILYFILSLSFFSSQVSFPLPISWRTFMKSAEGLGHIGSRVMLNQDNVVIFLINTKYLRPGPPSKARISSK